MEIVFVVDRTASMLDVFKPVAKLVHRYVLYAAAEGMDIERVGLVTVDDHYEHQTTKRGQEYSKEHNGWVARDSSGGPVISVSGPPATSYGMTDNLEEFAWWLERVPIGNGGDPEEAFCCGWWEGRNLSSEGHVWIVTDSYSRGWQRYGGESVTPCPLGRDVPDGKANVLMVSGYPLAENLWKKRGHNVVEVERVYTEDSDGDPVVSLENLRCGGKKLEETMVEVTKDQAGKVTEREALRGI
ncbi:hypothetical protein LCGC14_2729880 [marine sediment metagenome]|uniref:Uncharacterized protein n=1 Tax=marine sediment metagenome TaxID=412755 RepID=A0A0F8Z7Q3_9ZZZZ